MADIVVEKDEKVEEKEITPDPGSLEGIKKDPKIEQDNLTPEHPRYKEIWGKMKHLEKTLDERSAKDAEKDLLIEELRSWNKDLASKMESAIESVSKVGEKDNSNLVGELETKLSELKEERKKALRNVDYELEESLNDKISDLRSAIRMAKDTKTEKPEKKEKKEERKEESKLHPDIAEFYKISWMAPKTGDPEMRAYAKMLDNELLQDEDWKDRSVKERLQEVKQKTEKRFDWNKNSNRERGSGVDGGDHSGNSSSNSGGLSETELAIVKGLGITSEAYLKQKKFKGA